MLFSERRINLKHEFDGCLKFGTKEFNDTTKRNDRIDGIHQMAYEYFIDPSTQSIKNELRMERACPICQKNDSTLLFEKGGFPHKKCRCGFIFVNPTATDESRESFYALIEDSWSEVLVNKIQVQVDENKFKYGLEIIEHFSEKTGHLVDIGAGPGTFVEIARERNWKVTAVEINKFCIQQMEMKNIPFISEPLRVEHLGHNTIDAITMWETLEHINDVRSLLSTSVKILKPGGILFICVPNINALVTRILHEKSNTFAGFSHVNFFSIEDLTKLCLEFDLIILDKDNFISELGTIKNHLCYADAYGENSELELEFLNPEFLYSNFLGSRIALTCKKK